MDHRREENLSTSSAFPCLNCAYDLRAAIKPEAGEILCTECGTINQVHRLHHYGIRATAAAQLLALIALPGAALLLSAWVFALWSGGPIHTLLCLIFAPAVIAVHLYATWQLIDSAIVLTRKRTRWLKAIALISSAMIDLASCAAVARWFL